MTPTKRNYIEIPMPYGVEKVKVDGPFDGGPIPVEDLFGLISEETKKRIEVELRLRYKDADTCDYPILPQFFLAVYMKLKKIKCITTLRRVLVSDERLAGKLGFKADNDGVKIPSYSNLCLFIKGRLDENTIEKLSMILLNGINENAKRHSIKFGENVAHDGVVIRAHDRDAVYNKHYDTTMYKGEIGADVDTLIPIHGVATRGTDYDGRFAVQFAEKLDRIEIRDRTGYFDGSYSSLENFAVLNHRHHIRAITNVPTTQRRIAARGGVRNINRVYQKLHGKEDFVVNPDISTKLDMLLKYGKTEIVGYYYRNIHVKEFKTNMRHYGTRSLEETINNSVKNGLVDIENGCNGAGMRNRDHHVRLCVLAVQMVALIRLQNDITTSLTSINGIAC